MVVEMFAKDDIPANTELTYDYGPMYFHMQKILCRCGSAECRYRTLDAAPPAMPRHKCSAMDRGRGPAAKSKRGGRGLGPDAGGCAAARAGTAAGPDVGRGTGADAAASADANAGADGWTSGGPGAGPEGEAGGGASACAPSTPVGADGDAAPSGAGCWAGGSGPAGAEAVPLRVRLPPPQTGLHSGGGALAPIDADTARGTGTGAGACGGIGGCPASGEGPVGAAVPPPSSWGVVEWPHDAQGLVAVGPLKVKLPQMQPRAEALGAATPPPPPQR